MPKYDEFDLQWNDGDSDSYGSEYDDYAEGSRSHRAGISAGAMLGA